MIIAVVIIVSLAVNCKTEKEEVNTTTFFSSSVVPFTKATEKTQSISKWQNSSDFAIQYSSQAESTEKSETQSQIESKSENSKLEQQEPNENSINNNSSQSNNSYYRPQQSESSTKAQEQQTTKPPETTKDNKYLSYSSVSLHTDDVMFLTLIGAENGVSWTVGNSYILQNYGGGGNQCSFKALKQGSTTVTATYNGRSYTCYVTVN